MATDQADVSSRVMEESEVCSLPGGLASVRKQFEAQETATSHNVTQFHFHHRSVQEVSNSEVTVRSSVRQVIPANQQIHFYQDDMVTHEENNLTSSYDNQDQEAEEDLPRLTTKELRDRFEKTIEEAAPSKKVKVRVPKSELCTVCRRRVYPMEALIADRKKFHKSCFCCEHCQSKLSLGNYVSLHGHLYCLHHYKQLLKSKGNYGNGLGQTSPPGSCLIPLPDQLNWRYSISQSSVSSLDTSNALDKETKHNSKKISVVWPPQTQAPRKPFQLEDDMKLTKPMWPPQEAAAIPPNHQHRKTVPRSIL